LTIVIVALAALIGVLGYAPGAQAILKIEITQGVDTGIPVAIAPFPYQGAGEAPVSVSEVVQADLARSGRFQVLPSKDYPGIVSADADLKYELWRALKPEGVVVGSMQLRPDGKYDVQFRLYDVFKQSQLAGYRYVVTKELLRTVGHQIADLVYQKLTGERGAFNTRIAYITKDREQGDVIYRLQIADSDGVNPKTIWNTREPLLSPAWSPDGQRLAYVTFHERRTKVYMQGINEARRELIAEFVGINSAPAFSPDGRKLALTLSRDGNPEIYLLDLATRALKRITSDPAIDTEASWAPDGKSIVFTSDRSGRPQIYRMDIGGGSATRLTFEGDYNARASFAPDGKSITLVSGEQGRYHVATLRLDTGALQTLTDTPLDESPTFAPNGQMVLYASEVRGRGVLASVSADGRVRQLYRSESGDVREPAWSPYNRELQY
jgi:TolB protein